MKIYAKIRFYWGAFVISFIVAGLMIPLIYLFPDKKGLIMHKLNGFILFMIGAKIVREGERDEEANLFLISHQGIIDIITLEAIELTHFRWVAKLELFETPWFGRLLRKGDMISVDRENKAGLVKLLKDARESIETKGRAVAIFPEGTRNPGQKLFAFKSGAKLIAEKLSMRVQPIVVLGSKWILNEHDRTAHSGTVKVVYLDPVNAREAGENWYEDIARRMQEEIDRQEREFGILR